MLHYDPALPYLGGQIPDTNVIAVNPFHVLDGTPRSGLHPLVDLAGIIIHEYTHLVGHGEMRAHVEQFRFVLDAGDPRSSRYLEALEFAETLAQDPARAESLLEATLRRRYVRHYGEDGIDVGLFGTRNWRLPIRPVGETGWPPGVRRLYVDDPAGRPWQGEPSTAMTRMTEAEFQTAYARMLERARRPRASLDPEPTPGDTLPGVPRPTRVELPRGNEPGERTEVIPRPGRPSPPPPAAGRAGVPASPREPRRRGGRAPATATE